MSLSISIDCLSNGPSHGIVTTVQKLCRRYMESMGCWKPWKCRFGDVRGVDGLWGLIDVIVYVGVWRMWRLWVMWVRGQLTSWFSNQLPRWTRYNLEKYKLIGQAKFGVTPSGCTNWCKFLGYSLKRYLGYMGWWSVNGRGPSLCLTVNYM